MGLCKTYHKWQQTLEDLEDSLRIMNGRVKNMGECEDRGWISGGMVFVNQSLEDLKKSSKRLADLIDDMF